MHIHADLIHMGLPRCASTFLQKVAFAEHPGIHNMFRNDIDAIELKSHENHGVFLRLSELAGSPGFDYTQWHNQLAQLYERTPYDKDKKYVLSEEHCSGAQLALAYNFERIAHFLKEAFGETRILIVLREQYKWIYSIWAQTVIGGASVSLNSFVADRNPYSFPPYTGYQNIYVKACYDSLLECLFRVFGADNVVVVFYEDFRNNSSAFLGHLYEVIGVDPAFRPKKQGKVVNASLAYRFVRVIQLLNGVTKTQIERDGFLPEQFYWWYRRAIHKRFRGAKRRSRDVKTLVPQRYRDAIGRSNTRLASLLGRDVEAIGYDCAG